MYISTGVTFSARRKRQAKANLPLPNTMGGKIAGTGISTLTQGVRLFRSFSCFHMLKCRRKIEISLVFYLAFDEFNYLSS